MGGSGTWPGLASGFLQFSAKFQMARLAVREVTPLPFERAVLLKIGNVKSSLSGLLTKEGDKCQVQFRRTFYF